MREFLEDPLVRRLRQVSFGDRPFNPCSPSRKATTGKRRIIGQKESKCVTSTPYVRCCSHSYCWPCRRHRSRKSAYRSASPRRHCLSTSSLFYPVMVISGHPGTGLTPTTSAITTGCQVHG